jgi:FtsH-binding integral membrane protein
VTDPRSNATGSPQTRSPGWREVLLVAGAVVAVVLGLAAVTGLLPTGVQRLVFHSPLAIVVLVVGTVLVLWRVAGRGVRH